MSTLKLKNSVLKRYLHLTGTKKVVFWRFSAKVDIRTLQTYCRKEFLEILGRVMQRKNKNWEMISKNCCEVFCKTTGICSAKILKGVRKPWRFSAKILIAVLQKYWQLFWKKNESCSGKFVRRVPHSGTKWTTFL